MTFSIFDFRMTIWDIRALARGEAERERRGRVEPRAEVVRKPSGEAEPKRRWIFDFRFSIDDLDAGALRAVKAKRNFRSRGCDDQGKASDVTLCRVDCYAEWSEV